MRPIFLGKLALFTAQRTILSGKRPEKEKKEKSFGTPLFRAIPRDDKSHVMLYNVGF